ncbi:MAG TPA: lipase maturation factor family protein [Polyangiaceae bacterium]|nr:lipase maturation factor family protein [Polyangiaceae bacterium]
MTASTYVGEIWLSRLLFQRGLAALFVIAFTSALNQFPALLGERGLLPVPRFTAIVPFREAPSVFHAHYSDRFFTGVAGTCSILSLLALSGISEMGPWWLSTAVWLALWAGYLSIVNVGQDFYGFGWESMLVEAGFFAAFLGPAHQAPSAIPILLLRWILFRTEFGAGLIKLRHDPCWRELTCLFFHSETQPLPNPVSYYTHALPKPVLKLGVVFSHFVQLLVPFGLFAPQPIASGAASLMILHQLLLVISGNYAWLNGLTIVLGIAGLDDSLLHLICPLRTPALSPAGPVYVALCYLLLGVSLVLSVPPALNFFSKRQLMNYSFNPLHLLNAYGAFGSVTRERYEIVVEGTTEAADGEMGAATWREYEFKAKPGDVTRRPPQVAPYHLRLDWLMWFLPFSATIIDGSLFTSRSPERWFVRFVEKLLEGDRATLKLLRNDPFPKAPPARIRASFYRYEFTTAAERAATGAWWKRKHIGEFLPAVSLGDLRR